MLFVLAALLAAGDPAATVGGGNAIETSVPAAFVAEPPASDAPTEAEAAAADSGGSTGSAPQTTEFSLNAAAGTRGERRVEAIARASGRGLSLALGAIDFGGVSAPERQELLLGGQVGVLAGELRLVPDSAGLVRAAADLGVRFETVSIILAVRTASLGRAHLRGAGARLELEGDLAPGVRAGLAAAAWALQLDSPSTRQAWLNWGNSTLDWAQRCETGAWLSLDLGDLLSVTTSLSAAQSAQPDTYEARAQLAVEVPLGAVKLRVQSGLARQWPELWLADFSLGVAMSLY
jgi:hypothetical protein